ncbi:MAG: DUF3107 family protein [Acidimicrobiia bacterium]
MLVQIGVCDVERELEIEIDDEGAFSQGLEAALAGDATILWYKDIKGRKVGIPVRSIAYVAIEVQESEVSVGFG